jgi:uncharacterized protein (DUF362 family)/Pyruvate/2-oxoacid:ferredoxin oxidoreductase delta subunit
MNRSTVVLVKCDSYTGDEVRHAVQRGINLLGGMAQFAAGTERILLKPNALNASDPGKCVTTHPAVFSAVCGIFSETGCRLTYGDSPAFYSGWGKCGPTMKKSGFMDVAEVFSMPLADFDNGDTVSNPGGTSHRAFVIAHAVAEADGIISLPKLKSHALTRITGAVKNQFGCVPGMFKGQYHAAVPDVFDFSRLLVDITAYVRPRLYVMDAVMAMEGNGPQSGDPRKLGLLLLSRDPVALDAVAARIIGLAPENVPTCAAGEAAGLGTYRMENIDLLGDDIGTFVTLDFKVSRQPPVHSGANPLTRAIRNAVVQRPALSRARCTGCGTCVKACPLDPKALDFRAPGIRPPAYRYSQCIRCFCCQECCPSGAIRMHTPVLGRFLPVLSYLALLMVNLREKGAQAALRGSAGRQS